MPTKGNTPYHKCLITAQQTIDLINHRQTPDRISDAILKVLSDLSAEYRINIWQEKTGINLVTLAAFYAVLKRGSGRSRLRVKADYEVERRKREYEELLNRTAKN
jgi:hypothetical protein